MTTLLVLGCGNSKAQTSKHPTLVDKNLIKEALRNKIAIVGPTTLIAIIQIISRVWTNKQQSEDTVKVINQATSIYEAAVLVSESFNEFNDLYEKSNKKLNIKSKILIILILFYQRKQFFNYFQRNLSFFS